jgi:uncharacterized NAD(P)/FAD-binding protein YdhS/predicted metal-dependent enzyme (double-stranded beta helix superfamily)
MSEPDSTAPPSASPAVAPLTEALARLVERLDTLGSSPDLLGIARAVQAIRLTPADVAAFVEPNPHSYNRAPVVVREQYELLVMTWLPGQGSVPHDHSGSACALQVIQGEATEGFYRIAADGYADFEFETKLTTGGVAAFKDAGVHTVRNATGDATLVTVHAYAPRLRDYRRFVLRPASSGWSPDMRTARPTVVVVGGGFCGAMTAAQLLTRAARAGLALEVVIIERGGAVGEGVAYATRDPAHLLNVPAARMSAWPERAEHFLRWAQARDSKVTGYDFLPRLWYADYVREALGEAAAAAAELTKLTVLYDEVRRVARRPGGGWMVHMEHGASLRAAAVVLGIGHRPPTDPLGARWSGPRTRLIGDPWRPFAMNVVDPADPVIIIGTGLTAVDVLLSLTSRPRTGSVTLVSTFGLRPLAHAAQAVEAADLSELVTRLLAASAGLRVRDLLRELRRLARNTALQDWRSLIDGLRPHTARVCQAMNSAERRRFLRHVRPYWEAHRHRMPTVVAERFDALLASGLVCVMGGRVVAVRAGTERLEVDVRPRGDSATTCLTAAWIVNCTGPTPSNRPEANPVIGALLVNGELRVDELALGVETTQDGSAICADGTIAPDLAVVGTLRKAGLWESIAVPELRQQAALAAERIVRELAQGRWPGSAGGEP